MRQVVVDRLGREEELQVAVARPPRRGLAPSAWHTVALDRDGRYKHPKVVDEEVTISGYPGTVRRLVVTGLGREAATVIITNDRFATAKQLIERYARRMNIEQRLAESIRWFHLDALAGSVPLNVDVDVALSLLAGAVCASLRRRLTATTTPPQTRSNAGSSPQAVSSSTTVTPSSFSSSGAPTPRCFAKPTSPRSQPPGGGDALSASSSTTDRGRIPSARIGAKWYWG